MAAIKGVEIKSHVTIRKHLLKEGLHPYRRRKQPRLTSKQQKKRVDFAHRYADHDWLNTLVTDEL